MLQLLLQNFSTTFNIICPLLFLKPLPYILLGVRCFDITQMGVEPISAGPLDLLSGYNLDYITVTQLIIECHQPAIDLSSDAAVSHLSMNPVGKIKRR